MGLISILLFPSQSVEMIKSSLYRDTLLVVLGLLLVRKIIISVTVMTFVRQNMHQTTVGRILQSYGFDQIVDVMNHNSEKGGENYVFMLNRHALNMTMNWLCMTKHLPNVHDSSIFVTLDSVSSQTLARLWPDLRILSLNIQSLQEPFNYGDGPYQLFYLLRANLAFAFLQKGVTFWMTQQDTFWRSSPASLDISRFSDADIIFDRGSDANVTFIAGGYYRARPTPGAISFFQELSDDLSWWYAPDNAYMSSLCRRRSDSVNCGSLPFNAIPNWKWLYDNPSTSIDQLPSLLQFDGETKLGGKLATMKSLGFYFLDEANDTRCKNESSAIFGHETSNASLRPFKLTFAHAQFCVYQALIDLMYSFGPTSLLLDHVILPYAHFFMLSM